MSRRHTVNKVVAADGHVGIFSRDLKDEADLIPAAV